MVPFRGRSAILTYHSLDDSGSVISIPPSLFRRQMAFLAESGLPVVPLDQAVTSPGSVAITFDDGFCNLLDYAIPVLEQHHFPATIFVVSEFAGGKNNWPSQPHGTVPKLPLLSWSQLSSLPAGISPGAHTITHPDLTLLKPEECRRELRDCRNEIEQRTGRAARCLAYPYGASSPAVREMARGTFDLAVGTSLRFFVPDDDRMDIPRVDTYYLRREFGLEKLFTSTGRLYLGLRHLLREVRRYAAR